MAALTPYSWMDGKEIYSGNPALSAKPWECGLFISGG